MDNISESDVQILDVLYKQPGRVEVLKVRRYSNNEILCMKKLYADSLQEANTIQREIIAMAVCQHENIITIRSAFMGGSDREITNVVIFMDFYPEGDLEKLIVPRIKSRQFLPEEEILDYLQQLVSAYAYLEERKLAHRDIKPQNIFVTSVNNRRILKVGDLGSLAKRDGTQLATIVGTPMYLSPVLRRSYNNGSTGFSGVAHNVYKSDVYSLGITFLYLTSLNPVNELCILDNLEGKIKVRIDSLPEMYPRIKYLLESMLKVDEELRPDFIQLKKLLDGVTTSEKSDQVISVITEGRQQYSPIFHKCESCNKEQFEDELYIFTSGVLCKNCYNTAKGTFYPKSL